MIFYDFTVKFQEIMRINLFFGGVIYLKAVYVTGQNDRQSKILSGQIVILAGHCPLTGRYFEPCVGIKCADFKKMNFCTRFLRLSVLP